MTSTANDDASVEAVQWDALDGRRRLTLRTKAFLATVGVVALVFCYDFFVRSNQPTFDWWDVSLLDWLFVLSLLVLTFYILLPLVLNPRMTRYYWRQLRTDKAAVASLVYVCLFFLAGLFGPIVAGPIRDYMAANDPGTFGMTISQPPVGLTATKYMVTDCLGEVGNAACHGTWLHPLGTSTNGKDVALLILEGSRVALQIALITSMLVVPLATTVGTVAAYYGGRADEVLMRYVDVQQAIPPLFVYMVVRTMYHVELALMILIFGLLNWGGIARLVRSEALQKREDEYVMAARNAGSSQLEVVRRHVVPNVSSTVLTAVTLQVPMLIIVETTLSFLELGPITDYQSWGFVVRTAMLDEYFPTVGWWQSGATILVLVLTTVSFSVLGDALRDVLDPRVQERGR